MRSYKKVTPDERDKIFSLARAGIPDSMIMEKYDICEDTFLQCIDAVFCRMQRKREYKISLRSYKPMSDVN